MFVDTWFCSFVNCSFHILCPNSIWLVYLLNHKNSVCVKTSILCYLCCGCPYLSLGTKAFNSFMLFNVELLIRCCSDSLPTDFNAFIFYSLCSAWIFFCMSYNIRVPSSSRRLPALFKKKQVIPFPTDLSDCPCFIQLFHFFSAVFLIYFIDIILFLYQYYTELFFLTICFDI